MNYFEETPNHSINIPLLAALQAALMSILIMLTEFQYACWVWDIRLNLSHKLQNSKQRF